MNSFHPRNKYTKFILVLPFLPKCIYKEIETEIIYISYET